MEAFNSVIGLQDLNLWPQFQNPTSNIPKIEPIDEPMDKSPPILQIPTPSPSPVPLPVPVSFPTPSPPDPDVLSQYNRLSELFNAAIGDQLQNDGEVQSLFDSDDPYAGAIVVVPNPEDIQSNLVVSAPRGSRKYPIRSAELVRVSDLKSEDERYFRDVIRKTRMLFDSLRVFAIYSDDKARDKEITMMMVSQRRCRRGDLKAASWMRDAGLWLNRDKRIVGDIPGILIGDVFFCRMELCVVGLHGQVQAGIDYVSASHSSNGEPIATSIIVSGGYEDDDDSGDVIIYTGHGGQDKNNNQVSHQKLESGNLALERSMHYGVEVRVIRGLKCGNSSSPKIYVYDGLYRIVETWFDIGKAGFGVFKFRLTRIENQVEMGSMTMKFAASLKIRPKELRPNGYVTFDLSRKKETVPVYFFNDVDGDDDPIHYDYLPTAIFPHYVYNSGTLNGCDCSGGCNEDCYCALRNGGEFPYDNNAILVQGKPLVFECGPHCHCPPSCRNRVAQKGVRNRFEVFRSAETGWGVRSLDLIQAGSFICEYTGVVLTREQVQIFTMNGDSLIYPSKFAHNWKEWGDLSQIFSDYKTPDHPSIPPLDFAMDVSKMRNVACYMSHSPIPNVFVQPVLFDHNNVSFPHIMLFALENIPPMRELSLDYGMVDEYTPKLAICN